MIYYKYLTILFINYTSVKLGWGAVGGGGHPFNDFMWNLGESLKPNILHDLSYFSSLTVVNTPSTLHANYSELLFISWASYTLNFRSLYLLISLLVSLFLCFPYFIDWLIHSLIHSRFHSFNKYPLKAYHVSSTLGILQWTAQIGPPLLWSILVGETENKHKHISKMMTK